MPNAYSLSIPAISVVVGVALAASSRRAGNRGVWSACGVLALLLTAVAVVDWRRVNSEEAALAIYLAAAILPTIGATVVVGVLQRANAGPVVIALGGSLSWCVLAVLAILTAFLR